MVARFGFAVVCGRSMIAPTVNILMRRSVKPPRVLFSLREIFLVYSAKGANEILGKIFKLRAGSNSVIGSTELLVIFPAAYFTYIFHFQFLLIKKSIKARARAPCKVRVKTRILKVIVLYRTCERFIPRRFI